MEQTAALNTRTFSLEIVSLFGLCTPVAKVRWDNEEVWRVRQVLAEKLPVFNFLVLTQGTHKHGDDAKFVFAAAKKEKKKITEWNTGNDSSWPSEFLKTDVDENNVYIPVF